VAIQQNIIVIILQKYRYLCFIYLFIWPCRMLSQLDFLVELNEEHFSHLNLIQFMA